MVLLVSGTGVNRNRRPRRGAVLGSRIIDHIALMRGERRELDKNIGNIRRHFDNRIDSLQRIDSNWEENRASDVEAIQQGRTVRTYATKSLLGMEIAPFRVQLSKVLPAT